MTVHTHQPESSDSRVHSSAKRNMLAVLSITAGIMTAEIIGCPLANSLTLLSDAGYMLTDYWPLA